MRTSPHQQGANAEQGELPFRSLLWQPGILLLGFGLIVVVYLVFTGLIKELDEKTANERARLFIGEEISRQLQGIESDVYQLATITGNRGQESVSRRIKDKRDTLNHALTVLQQGGAVQRLLRLNLEGHDYIVREVHYNPSHSGSNYVMEVIDLLPKLEDIDRKIENLRELLSRRENDRDNHNTEGLLQKDREIKLLLKQLPAHFSRLNENANRLFFEGHQQLADLEKQIAKRKRWLEISQLSLIILIMAAVLALTGLFARQIANSNQQLRRAWAEMRNAKDDAERASQAKSRFVSRMSHELRTPMNAILGFAQLLEIDPLLTAEQRTQVSEINKAGNHLLSLINDVLDFAKIEAGQITFEKSPFDLIQTVDEVLAIMGERAYSAGLEFNALVSPELPSRVLGNPMRLRQVLINLLGNGVKFTEQGEVGIRVEPTRDRTQVHFKVWDTGVGFDNETAKRLFQPFVQADESTSRRYGGSGLGLLICKEFVQGMGGELQFESSPGKGSSFWFSLPLERAAEIAEKPAPLAGTTVLIVSGDRLFTGPARLYLEALGGQVSCVDNKADAQATVSSLPPPQLILLDTPFRDLAGPLSEQFQDHPVQCLFVVKPKESRQIALSRAEVLIYKPVTYTRLKDSFSKLPPVADTTGECPSGTEKCARTGLSGHVLLVEDNPVNQLVALEMLTHLGITVDLANNGLEALSSLASQSYDLVLMDVQMPKLDGYQATHRIRALEKQNGSARLPIIAMTANALNKDRERCLASGMDDHLAKPVTLERLEALLGRWLKQGTVQA